MDVRSNLKALLQEGSGRKSLDDAPVEKDPTGRWTRYPRALGRGSFKAVYKGFDANQGIEIAWNKLNSQVDLKPEDQERLAAEVNMLQELDHPNIIKCLGGWRSDETGDVNFITELFTSGTLREFRHKHKGEEINLLDCLKRWGTDILTGLEYLHSHNPPIIHRDLKCDNVFINGHTGQVKIADLGVATLVKMQRVSGQKMTVVGTPEFMAPELYDEDYDERVDLYAFGMLFLELATLRFPYDEFKTAAQIFKAVTTNKPPAALGAVEDPEVSAIIRACIEPDPDKRPSTRELLDLDFFKVKPRLRFRVDGVRKEGSDTLLDLGLQMLDADGKKKRSIQFEYEIGQDTAESISEEMMESFDLTDSEAAEIASLVDSRVHSLTSCTGSLGGPKMTTRLVRVPSSVMDPSTFGVEKKASIRVTPNKDKPLEMRIELCMKDRKGLLWELTNVLQTLPIHVKNGTINTLDSGMALDVFDIVVEPGSALRAEELLKILRANITEE